MLVVFLKKKKEVKKMDNKSQLIGPACRDVNSSEHFKQLCVNISSNKILKFCCHVL